MKIIETFKSLQGEGGFQGEPCFFVRLAGCNLRCAWCDTKYSFDKGTEVSVASIIDDIIHSGFRYVCITGGEPLIQMEEVLTLAKELNNRGIIVSIETNGTKPFKNLHGIASICMDVKCPSSEEESDLSLLKDLQEEDEVKFVIGTKEDFEYMKKVIAEENNLKGKIFVTPVFGTDFHWLVEAIISENLPVRFQLQLHKQVNIA